MNGPYLLRDNVGASLVESDLLVMEILGSGLEAKDWVFTPLHSCCQGTTSYQLSIFLPKMKKDIERFIYECSNAKWLGTFDIKS